MNFFVREGAKSICSSRQCERKPELTHLYTDLKNREHLRQPEEDRLEVTCPSLSLLLNSHGEEGAESEGKALSLPADLLSNLNL